MHERSLIADLLRKIEAIARRQQAGRVPRVKVPIGGSRVSCPIIVMITFTHAARTTVAEGARLEREMLTEITDPYSQEMLLESVEVED